MGNHFSTPESFPPFGLSDHSTVIVKPKERILNQHTRKKINIRDMRESKKTSLGRYLSNVDWSCINMQSSCEGKLRIFNELITNGINNIMPERSIKVYPKDAPWMTIKLKELIRIELSQKNCPIKSSNMKPNLTDFNISLTCQQSS